MNDKIIYYLTLSRISGVTLKRVKKLIEEKYFSLENLLNAPSKELIQYFKNNTIISKIRALYQDNNEEILKIKSILTTCKENKIDCITIFDENYPKMLRNLKYPPDYLFIKGSILPQDEKSFSIIGTRNPTHYGHHKAREIAYDLAKENYTIISGLARGVDTEAHIGALAAGGRTIAVIGSGLLNIYPPENEELSKDISKNGAIITQSFPYESVKKWTLQTRNKLNCGLSIGSIFIEGTEKSGSKWQIKFASEQKKLMFGLIPKDKNRKNSWVPLYIINKLKGYPISSASDVIEIYKKNNSRLPIERLKKGFSGKTKSIASYFD